MRVLVTGGSGFVGRHLTAYLRQQGDEPVVWGFGQNADAATVRVDLRDQAATASQDLTGLDAVIHLAGLAQVGASFADAAGYVCQNSAMQINVFEALLAQNAHPRILVVSTGAVYERSADEVTEGSPVSPTSPYAVSKLTQEMLGLYYANRGFDVIIARPLNHFGPGQQRGFLVADIASQIAAAEPHGHGQVIVGDLSSSRDWTDVRDIVAAYASLLRTGRPGEIYNVCSGVSRSGEEILEALLAMTTAHVDVRRTAALARPADTSVVRASSEKIRRETGWLPKIPLESTLLETLNEWRSR